jgi:hypothetical protein
MKKSGIVIAIGSGAKPAADKKECCEMCGQELPQGESEEMEDQDSDPALSKIAEMMAMRDLKK